MTHAALAATATVVPVGTVVAAVAEVGIGLAEVGALIADIGSEVERFFSCFFGCSPPPLSKNQEKLKKIIGKTLARSKAGYPEDQKKLVAIMMEINPQMKKSKDYTRLVARGMKPKDADKVAGEMGKSQNEIIRRIVAEAQEYAKTLKIKKPPAPKKPLNLQKIKATIDAGAKVLTARTNAAVKKKKVVGIDGVFVTRSGNKTRGKFVSRLNNNGGLGWVVLKSGKVIGGRYGRA